MNKMKLKNLSHAHIHKNGDVILFYRKKDKESGKEIDWQETVDFTIPIWVAQKVDKFSFTHLCAHDRIVKLLKDTIKIEIWPNNASHNTNDFGKMQVITTVLFLKGDTEISFNKILIDSKLLWDSSCLSICNFNR